LTFVVGFHKPNDAASRPHLSSRICPRAWQ
jgi:hypothetical protein